MNVTKGILFVASVLLLVACKNGTLQDEVPARVQAPTPAGKAELQAAVAEALGRTEVLLADDAFIDSSTLVVERRPARDPAGNRLPGRELEKPERFQLLLSGGDCILLRESSGERWTLREVRCQPE